MNQPAIPRVTVVVPTRDRRELLAQTLDSILGQEGVEVRVLVVDEASTDGTAEWLAGLADARVSSIRHDVPLGPAAARNAGLDAVTTPWVALCDDDDLWAPDKLALQLEAIAATPGARWSTVGTVSVNGALQIVGHQRPPASGDVRPLLDAHNVVPAGASTVLVETALLRELGGFDRAFRSCEDFECWIRLADRSPLATVDRPLIAYRVAGQNRSNAIAEMREMHDAVLRKHRRGFDEDDARHGDLIYAQHLARFPLRQGRRLAAARAYLDIAWRWRLPTHVAHAGLALVAPGYAERRRAVAERAEVPASWAADAERWLEPLRSRRRQEVGAP